VGPSPSGLLNPEFMYGKGENIRKLMENSIREITTLADHLNTKDESPTFNGTRARELSIAYSLMTIVRLGLIS